MTGDDSSKKRNSSSSDLNLVFGDPLYLHPNGTPIVTVKLTDNTNPALSNQWDMCNYVVFTLILNSLSSDLYVGAIYAKSVYELWNDLKETYDKVDSSDVFNLHKSINYLSQNGASLADYYNKLNSLWKQFDAMVSLPACTCEAAKHFEKHNQLIKLMQFLMGLDDNYLAIRSNILTREPLPLVKDAFAIVSGEESHRNITFSRATKPTASVFAAKTFDKKRFNNNNNSRGSSSSSNTNNKGPNPNIKCTNCNKIRHIVDRCFKILGYPAGYVKRNFIPNSKPVTNNNTIVDPPSNKASSNTNSNSPVSLSIEQLTRLMNLLNDNGVSTANANSLITKIGDLKINNNITLNDVLDVPEYTVSLLSVHKLSRDNKLFVGFNESNCYIQDLKANKILGIGRQFNGLLLFMLTLLLSPDINQRNDDSEATYMDETNNTHPEGIIPNETYFITDFYENSEFNYETEELPANTLRRSSRQTKLSSSLNGFIVEGKVKYGVEKVVNYANLNHDNYCFVFALNKSVEPTCYEEAILDSNWIDAMNAEIEALNENHTYC
ncbi:hypothetical protein Tco_0636314 [Tanacetum coccineum]